ncbi:transporter associated domain-containing protein [Amycolatopsis sp. NPDC023774]|uniref:hemolysin family protein n=1 Tax=Amycolatopsis sp. NPDC023774 TaxID=3155015 RepID=UPI003410482F
MLGEPLPENFTIAKPIPLARALSGSTLVHLTVAGPVLRFFDAAANRLLRTVGIEPVEELPQGTTEQDLQRIIGESHARGHLDDELSQLLDRGLNFRGLVVEQAMTPRVEVHTVRADEPVSRVVEPIDTGNSRFPVIGENVDDLVRVVGLAEVLTVWPGERAATPIRQVAPVPVPVLVRERLPLPAVLERLRAEHRRLACVLDEYGGFAAVVTLEDLAGELVGEVQDEDDPDDGAIERCPDGSWAVLGRLRIDEIADATGIALPEHDEYETISGLVLRGLGRAAQASDEVALSPPGSSDEPA